MNEPTNKPKTLSFLVAIVDMQKGEKVTNFLNQHNYRFHFVLIAEGTAPPSIRKNWRFGETEKSVIWGLVPSDHAQYLLDLLKMEFLLTKQNAGIAFVIPIKSFADPIIASHIAKSGDMPNNYIPEGEIVMEEKKYSLLLSIAKKGYSDDIMDAAREAGARGGTVFKARGTGDHESTKFLGLTIVPEKDVVMILAKKGSRTAIMQAIYDKAGLHTEGNGLVIALPVERVLGAFNLNQE